MLDDKIQIAIGYYKNAIQKQELAEYCINTGKYKQAIPLDYYYIFNLCRLIYSLEYTDISSHKTLLGNFNKTYIHEQKIFNRKYGSFLHTLEKQRGLCDYEANYPMDKDMALFLHEESKEFATYLLAYVNQKYKDEFTDIFSTEDIDKTDDYDPYTDD